ncbi:ATPase RavA [bacterium HR23]|nr:ATPase RavA [bacterium HR23]
MGEKAQTLVARLAQGVREEVGKAIVGKREAIDLCLVAILCGGHILIQDVPGIGKTTLAKALARALGCSFKRIQFTPDLTPGDVLGVSVYNQRSGEFVFQPGPIFAHVLLADEINRATPRTQSALLEAMQERQVTVDGVSHPLPRPFLVIATQNPIEMEGTFPLPEAQLDRFLLRVHLGYPSLEEEMEVLARGSSAGNIEQVEVVASPELLQQASQEVERVRVADPVRRYVVLLGQATRQHEALALGASPRALLALYRGAQALASLRGRDFVVPDDVKSLVIPVLAHRLVLTGQARLRGRTTEAVLQEVLTRVPVSLEPG